MPKEQTLGKSPVAGKADEVAKLTQRLRIEKALERVRAAVFRMEKSEDIVDIAAIIWEELRDLGYRIPRCSISIFDEEHDFYGGYHVYAKNLLLERLAVKSRGSVTTTVLEGPLAGEGLGFRKGLLEAWHQKRVFRHTITTEHERAETAHYLNNHYGSNFGANDIPETYLLYVPFEYGVVGVASHDLDPEQFNSDDEELLSRFGEVFANGYRRFLEMREREVQQAVDHLRAEVASMRVSGDIVDVIVELGAQLRHLGLAFRTCSIGLIDEEADIVRLYGVTPDGEGDRLFDQMRQGDRSVIPSLSSIREPILIRSISPGLNLGYTVEPAKGSPVVEERNSSPRIARRAGEGLTRMAKILGRRWKLEPFPLERVPRTAIRVPFSHGSIAVSSLEPDVYTLRDAEVVASFADALTLGFTRFLDFEQLERRNRQLEIEKAVNHLRAEVASMRQTSDILEVITELGEQLDTLRVAFDSCSISVIDEKAGLVRIYAISRTGSTTHLKFEKVARFQSLKKAIDLAGTATDEPVFVKRVAKDFGFGYVTEPLENSKVYAERQQPPRILNRSEADVEAEVETFRRRWRSPAVTSDWVQRSVVLVPFSHGRIAIGSLRPISYSQSDVSLVASFADALSLGFTRFMDFKALEERNRDLEIERAVERIQNAVQAMNSSADIVRVIPLVSEELIGLGIEFDGCSISIVDTQTDRVRVYVTGPAHSLRLVDAHPEIEPRPFSQKTVDKLQGEDGPFQISGIPGAGELVVAYMSAPLDSHHGQVQNIKHTTVESRSEEEVQRLIPEYEKRWKVSPWPQQLYIRSLVRVPFSGGAISLVDHRAGSLNHEDARILERFAEAFSLGYARYLDFKRLEEQNRALEAASRLKSDFLANMSHEIRTPMNAVLNFSSLILDGLYGEISDEMRDAVEEIDRNGEALLSLINDLLDLSKIEAGAMKLHYTECYPDQCVDNAISALEYKAREKGLAVIREVEEGLPKIVADDRRVTQHILSNLFKNAIKFTAEGEIRLGASLEDGNILFWVADTGIGIPRAEQESIFGSFHQVDSSMTRKVEGTGLGLTIAREFVEMHGGQIWLESEPGKGSIFRFTVPIRPPSMNGSLEKEEHET